jgi:hypothetical protein
MRSPAEQGILVVRTLWDKDVDKDEASFDGVDEKVVLRPEDVASIRYLQHSSTWQKQRKETTDCDMPEGCRWSEIEALTTSRMN